MRSVRKALGVLVAGVAVFAGVAAVVPLPRAAAQGGDQPGTLTFGPIIQGEVTQKITTDNDGSGELDIIVDNGVPMLVDRWLYNAAEVGSVVRFDGVNWTIVRPFDVARPFIDSGN